MLKRLNIVKTVIAILAIVGAGFLLSIGLSVEHMSIYDKITVTKPLTYKDQLISNLDFILQQDTISKEDRERIEKLVEKLKK